MGKLVNKKALSEFFGISEPTFTKYQKQGLPFVRGSSKGHSNAYDTESVFRWLVDKELSGRLEGNKSIDKDYEQARLARAQADAKELDNAERRKELASIELLEWALGKACTQISAALEAIPLRIKKRVPKLVASDIDIIKKEIIRCQNIAADAVIDFDEFNEEIESDSGG